MFRKIVYDDRTVYAQFRVYDRIEMTTERGETIQDSHISIAGRISQLNVV